MSAEAIQPLAGKPAPESLLVNVPKLVALGGAGAGTGGPAMLMPLLAAGGTAGDNLIVKRLDLRDTVHRAPGRMTPP